MGLPAGPISLAESHTLVWLIGTPPPGLAEEISGTGAAIQTSGGDPMATLVHIQRLAVALALQRDLDPDRPRNLTRSVVLSANSSHRGARDAARW